MRRRIPRGVRVATLSLVLLFALTMFPACGGGDDQPPAIPHSTTQTDDAYCLGCHQSGAGGAKVTPHPTRTGCVSCHKPQS
ncbi:MAG: hypothetical protein GYA21_09390 [Myxococcales bacterium]|nr:hypothetical protein [Myxococcales bacterium]